MNTGRRKLLKALSASCLLLPLAKLTVAGTEKKERQTYFLSSSRKYDGKFYLNGLNASGERVFSTPLPERGHGIVTQPHGSLGVIAARRPGYYFLVFDKYTGQIYHHLNSAENRHSYGHVLFSKEGRWLYSSENDFDHARGVISIRDSRDGYKVIDEFPSYGIGPHEMAMLSDKRTLVVANGGILTHPDTGRTQLNLDTMSPSLAYIDTQSGKLVELVKLDNKLHQNSIRHLAVNHQDQVCFVMQFAGPENNHPPLVGLHKLGEQIKLLSAPAQVQMAMRNYCGSVTIDQSGTIAAVSSPRGNIITFWSLVEANYLSRIIIDDGCGIAATKQESEFVITSGNGSIYRYSALAGKLSHLLTHTQAPYQWDNHLSRV